MSDAFGHPVNVDRTWAADEILAAAVRSHTESIASLIEADPHQWSTRPCQTCAAITVLLGRPFGCIAKAQR